ncbi:hypothetical protein ACF0H5_004072 [Mactra antiquata]
MSLVHNPHRYNSVSFNVPTRQNYSINSYFPSRKPRPNSLTGHRTFKKDINDNMRHATLINIVAAVNEDIGSKQQDIRKVSASTYNTGRNRVTILSNIVFPHDKTVSIPQTKQRDFSVPEKVVSKKPVYYKHSKDLEVNNRNNQIKLFEDGDSYNIKVKLSKLMEKENEILERENVSKLKTEDKKVDDTNKVKKADDKAPKSSRDSESRMSSGVRRLGSLKRSEPRQLHELHKCDAIDLLDKINDIRDPAKSALDDSRKLIPTNQVTTRVPYIRTKSLPVMFPTKTTNKSTWSSPSSSSQKQHLVLSDRPLSRSLRQRTPDSMYKRMSNLPGGFGFDDMSINNGVNEVPDMTAPLVHDSSKIRKNVTSTATDRLKRSKSSKSPTSPIREMSTIFLTSLNGEEEVSIQRRITASSTLYKSKRALHEAVKRVLNGRTLICEPSLSRKMTIEERKEPSIKYKRSYQPTSAYTHEILSDRKSPKKVQFQRSDSSAGTSDSSATNCRNESNSEEIEGGSTILKKHTSSVRSFSPGIQHMSSKELLRLEQKLIPVSGPSPVSPENAVFFSTSSAINLQRTNSDLSYRPTSSNGGSVNCDKGERVEHDDDLVSLDSDLDERNVIGEQGSDSEDLYNHVTGNRKGSDFYKLVKAFENDPYCGYEHKKLRRTVSSTKPRESDTNKPKPQYVKVKLS